MATTRTNRQTEATRQENSIDCRIRELQETNNLLGEQEQVIRDQIQKNLEEIKQLKERKRELKEKDSKKTLVWDKDSPIKKIVPKYKYDDLRNLIGIWQKGIKKKIDIQTVYFNFDPKFKPRFIRSLAEIFKRDIPVFKVSKNQVFKYLQEHTNLGRWDSIKRAVNREIAKK